MAVRINDIAPDFTAESTAGTIRFHEWLGDSYGIIFSHPRDFTPVCTTEFAAGAQLAPEWARRQTKVIGVSVDSTSDHDKWQRGIWAVGSDGPWFVQWARRSAQALSRTEDRRRRDVGRPHAAPEDHVELRHA